MNYPLPWKLQLTLTYSPLESLVQSDPQPLGIFDSLSI